MFRSKDFRCYKRFIIIPFLFLVGCSSNDVITKYKDREVLVPDIRIQACIQEQVKICKDEIITYRDLVNCYLYNKNEIEKINQKIKECNNETIKTTK